MAASLIQTVRNEYEARIAKKEADVPKREAEVRARQEAVKVAQKAIDDNVAEKLKTERAAIAEEEAKKARLAGALDLDAKTKELDELQEVLNSTLSD